MAFIDYEIAGLGNGNEMKQNVKSVLVRTVGFWNSSFTV
jgi:hypothetical protein